MKATPHPTQNCRGAIGVFGFLCLDLLPEMDGDATVTFVPGSLQEVGPCATMVGGVVGNTGLALHRLGIPVKMAGAVGDDAFGHLITAKLHEYAPGCDQAICTKPAHTAYCVVFSPPGQDRMFFTHTGVNAGLSAADLPESFFNDLALLHFGYPPLCRTFAAEQGRELQTLFTRAHGAGVITSLDMSLPAPGTFAAALDWQAYLQHVLPVTDVFLPSLDELCMMLKAAPTQEKTMLLPSLAAQLIEMGAAVAAIKLGSDGLYVKTTSDRTRLQRLAGSIADLDAWLEKEFLVPCFQVETVGTTGAGDATIAGFLAGIVTGAAVEDAAQLAVGTGACSVTAQDAISGIVPLATMTQRIADGWPKRSFSSDYASLTTLTGGCQCNDQQLIR